MAHIRTLLLGERRILGTRPRVSQCSGMTPDGGRRSSLFGPLAIRGSTDDERSSGGMIDGWLIGIGLVRLA
jgi:hypothetical protein